MMSFKRPQYDHSRARRLFLLVLLAVMSGYNFLDVQGLALANQAVETSFHLSDTYNGMLGLATTVFYATFGIPIARWADRGNRVSIITLALGLRTVLSVISGTAHSITEFLLIRIGVSVGEAGCVPPSYSLLGDYFGRSDRPRAFGIYICITSICSSVGYLLCGWLDQSFGWREMLIILGLPGILLTAAGRTMLREPRLIALNETQASMLHAETTSTWDAYRGLLRNTTFRHLLAALCINAFFTAGSASWESIFITRSFGLSTMAIGAWFSVIYGLGMMVGTYCGGHLASRYAPNNEPLQFKWIAALNVGVGALLALAYLSRSAEASLVLTTLGMLVVSGAAGPIWATIETVVPERARATSIATVYLMCNLVGAGLGPFGVGALSDALHRRFGVESLRYAMLAMSPGFAWAGWHLWRTAHTVEADIGAIAVAGELP